MENKITIEITEKGSLVTVQTPDGIMQNRGVFEDHGDGFRYGEYHDIQPDEHLSEEAFQWIRELNLADAIERLRPGYTLRMQEAKQALDLTLKALAHEPPVGYIEPKGQQE